MSILGHHGLTSIIPSLLASFFYSDNADSGKTAGWQVDGRALTVLGSGSNSRSSSTGVRDLAKDLCESVCRVLTVVRLGKYTLFCLLIALKVKGNELFHV